MKRIFSTVSTTIKVLQLLSNPEVMALLSKKTGEESRSFVSQATRLGRGDVFAHKHYMVQVIN